MRVGAWLLVFGVGVFLTLAPSAHALVEPAAPLDPQPLAIPIAVGAGEMGDTQQFNPNIPMAGNYVTLPSLFKYRGENIDYQTDAKTEPSTFSPLCSFSGTLVLRGGGCAVAFGWYNAVQSGAPAPTAAEVYPLIPANDPVVYSQVAFAPLAIDPPNNQWALKTFTASDIRNDARYEGGEIGFVMIGGGACSQNKYSQRALNQPCTSCTPVEPFITTVVYASTKEPNAYYMAFEDLPVSPTSFTANNDGDFNDFVFYITGLVCAGGGEPCDTGKQGACAVGKTDCSEAGKPGQCREVVKPTIEKCDNADNDCNGMVDDGELCDPGFVCDHGSCVGACGTAEFRCRDGLECDHGFCVDPRCVGKVCDAGKACRAGTCVGACDGVTCPIGEECQLGHCVDLCADVTCLAKQICENGLCMAECGCRACGAGKACGESGKCVETGCEKTLCPAGQVCTAGGTCKDSCDGAVCPGKAACVDGQCMPPVEDMNPTGSGGTDAGGSISIDLGGSLSLPGSGGSSVLPGSAGANNNPSRPILKSGETATGCNCKVAAAPRSSGWAWLAVGLGLAALGRRRRAS